MATFELDCKPAQPRAGGGFAVVYSLAGAPDPMPSHRFEAKSVDAALSELEAYKTAAGKLGVPVAVSIRVAKGPAPRGWNQKAKELPFHHGVGF